MRDVELSGWLEMKVSVSALPSSESFQIAVSTVRPPRLRTTFQLPGASTVMEMVLPRIPGWSVPSATSVSESPTPAKVSVYRFAPAGAIVIWSASLLLERLSFHLPMKGSSAALDVAAIRQAKQSNRMVGFSMKRSSSISAPRMDASSDNRESRLRKPAHKSNNPVTFDCLCSQSPPACATAERRYNLQLAAKRALGRGS